MRLFQVALIIVLLLALDRAFMDGQNAAILLSLARRAALAINVWASDLLSSALWPGIIGTAGINSQLD
jgi:hypothetical protein